MNTITRAEAKPFIKWVGGKGQLLSELLPRVPKTIRCYHEPFVGGGALFYALALRLKLSRGKLTTLNGGASYSYSLPTQFSPAVAKLSDINGELINAYQVVRHLPDKLIKVLEDFDRSHSESFYYSVRSWDRDPELWENTNSVYRAARFIYLNKTCYNGLYRVNMKGQFNASFGRYTNPLICDKPTLKACSQALSGVHIDYRPVDSVLDVAVEGDFIYFDPPYAPVSATSDFTSYTKQGFDVKDQIALKNICVDLDRNGIKWMLSNSNAPLIRDLYQRFNVETVQAGRSVNSKGSKRGKVDELIIRNYG